MDIMYYLIQLPEVWIRLYDVFILRMCFVVPVRCGKVLQSCDEFAQ
jgi:hypothetical protein